MTVSLHTEITYKEGENKEESQTGYNDKVVHADVTFNEYTKPGGGTGNIDEGTLEELQVLVSAAKTAANTAKNAADTAVAASEEAALSRDASQANAGSASTSATTAQDDADRAEQAAIRAEEAADRAEQSGSGGGSSSSGGTLDEETLQQINDLVDEAKNAATSASGSATSAAESAVNADASAAEAKDYLDQMADVTIDLSKVSGVLDVAHGGTGQSTENGLKSYLEGLGFSTSSGTSIDLPLSVAQGGTGATTAAAAWTTLGGGSIGKLNTVSLTANVSGTLPVANGGTGVTSLDELKDALGITDAEAGDTSSNYYELTEASSFDFQSPTTGRLFVKYTNMTNFPNDSFLKTVVYAGGDNEYIESVETSEARCIIECTKVTDSSGNVAYHMVVARCNPTVAPAENQNARCYGYGTASGTTITWAFRQDYW